MTTISTHQFISSKNGEKINVNITENGQGIEISIDGQVMKVSVNDEVLHEPFEKDVVQYIPPSLRSFVTDYSFRVMDVTNGVLTFSLFINGELYGCNIRERENEPYLEMRNVVYDAEKIKQRFGMKTDMALSVLKNHIKSIGYSFDYCTDGEEYKDIYTLSVPISDFDESYVLGCLTNWMAYNRIFKTYMRD